MSQNKKEKAKAEAGDSEKKIARQAAADRRKARAPLKKKADEAGLEVERIAAEVAKFDRRLANPKLFQQEPDKAKRFARGRANAQKALEKAEEKWMLLLEKFEDSKKAP
jgi:ATP-binding cassette subfamily F protein 3